MSKNISILEGQAGKKFGNVKKLITELPNTADCEWVPEDETKLTYKRIEKNGTYYAKNEKDDDKKPFYGFSRVTVAVSSKTSGKKKKDPPTPSGHDGDWNYPSDGDGNDYSYDVDGDGNLIETGVPSYIKVTTPPTKVDYSVGETIDYTGIEVTVYNGDGTVFTDSDHPNGKLQFSELTFPVKQVPESGS